MWTSNIEKTKSKNDHERLEQAEDDIQTLKEVVAWLQKRIEELEKKNDDNNND